MAENMMCPEHKSNSDTYRKNWELIFKKPNKKKEKQKASTVGITGRG